MIVVSLLVKGNGFSTRQIMNNWLRESAKTLSAVFFIKQSFWFGNL